MELFYTLTNYIVSCYILYTVQLQ